MQCLLDNGTGWVLFSDYFVIIIDLGDRVTVIVRKQCNIITVMIVNLVNMLINIVIVCKSHYY